MIWGVGGRAKTIPPLRSLDLGGCSRIIEDVFCWVHPTPSECLKLGVWGVGRCGVVKRCRSANVPDQHLRPVHNLFFSTLDAGPGRALCRANSAHVRQLGPDSGRGVRVEVLNHLRCFLLARQRLPKPCPLQPLSTYAGLTTCDPP